MQGWIKLHRKLQQSPMYRSLNCKQRDVFIQCLLLANHVENEWEWGARIHKIEPGQFITSLESIASVCSRDVSVQSVRTSLLKLERWGFLTNKSTKTGRLITIINWDSYQGTDEPGNKDTNRQPTKPQQTANKELTTNKNVKNEKNGKNEKKPYSDLFEEFWKHSGRKGGKFEASQEYEKLLGSKVLPPNALLIEKVKLYLEHCAANDIKQLDICRWIKRRRWEDETKPQTPTQDPRYPYKEFQ